MAFGLGSIHTKLDTIIASIAAAAGLTITPKTLSNANDTVEAGYYEATTLSTVDADLAVGNIKKGTVVFGKTGTYVTPITGDAAAGEVKTGKTFYANDAETKLTGNGTKTLSAANDTVAAGYYEATTLHAVDADLATGNIKKGVTVFGIAGSDTVVDVSDTTAVAADVAAGKFFYLADGTKVEGTKV